MFRSAKNRLVPAGLFFVVLFRPLSVPPFVGRRQSPAWSTEVCGRRLLGQGWAGAKNGAPKTSGQEWPKASKLWRHAPHGGTGSGVPERADGAAPPCVLPFAKAERSSSVASSDESSLGKGWGLGGRATERRSEGACLLGDAGALQAATARRGIPFHPGHAVDRYVIPWDAGGRARSVPVPSPGHAKGCRSEQLFLLAAFLQRSQEAIRHRVRRGMARL